MAKEGLLLSQLVQPEERIGPTASQTESSRITGDEIVANYENIYDDYVMYNGVKYNYRVRVPENPPDLVNADVYCHGSPYKFNFNMSTDNVSNYYVNNPDSPTLEIMLNRDFYYLSPEENVKALDLIFSKLESEYGLLVNNVSFGGASHGGLHAIAMLAQYNVDHNVTENNFVSLYGAGEAYRNIPVNEEGLKYTYILMYGKQESVVNRFGNLVAGLIDIETKWGGSSHDKAPYIAVTDGAIDLMSGSGDLKNHDVDYYFYIYDKETGTWKEYSYEQLKELIPEMDLSFEGIRQSKLDYLLGLENYELEYNRPATEDYIKNIMKQISNVASNIPNNVPTFSSTTKVPNIESEYISLINTAIIDKMCNISNLVRQLVLIGESIELLETVESEEASNLEISGVISSQEEIKPEPEITPDKPSTPNPTPVEPGTNTEVKEEMETPPVEEEIPNKEEDTNYDMEQDFPTYENLNNNSNRKVTEKDGYKEVIHYRGNEVIGIEHYYDFKTEEEATAKYEEIINKYIGEESAKKAIQNDRYIKVTFDPAEYNN